MGAVTRLDATAVLDEEAGAVTVFAVNRDQHQALALDVDLRRSRRLALAEHIALSDDDPDATNTAEQPDRVATDAADRLEVEGRTLRAELPARSWNVLRLTGGALG